MTVVSVVGVGPGDPLYLTPLARRRIEEAEILVGGQRLLDLFPEARGEKVPLTGKTDLEEIFRRFQRVVVLASGDPLLFGILDWVLRLLPLEDVEVVPGISSLQHMLARLRFPLKGMVVTSLHGREREIDSLLRVYETVVVFTDEKHTPVTIARKLMESGFTQCQIYVGENLSTLEESIRCFTVEELVGRDENFDLNLVVIRRCTPFTSASPIVFFDGAMSP